MDESGQNVVRILPHRLGDDHRRVRRECRRRRPCPRAGSTESRGRAGVDRVGAHHRSPSRPTAAPAALPFPAAPASTPCWRSRAGRRSQTGERFRRHLSSPRMSAPGIPRVPRLVIYDSLCPASRTPRSAPECGISARRAAFADDQRRLEHDIAARPADSRRRCGRSACARPPWSSRHRDARCASAAA